MRTVDQIREAIKGQPFRPFDLKLVNGTTHTVTHPDYLMIPTVRRPREVIYFVPLEADDYETHWIDLGLIQEVVVPSPSAAT